MKTKAANRFNNDSWLFAFTHWNWKAAIVTAVLRGAACMAALRHIHPHARHHFSLVEMAYVLLTSGIFSAWQQQALGIRPRYFAWSIVVLIVPMTSLGADAVAHAMLDHVNAHALGIGALIFTTISAMFHWHLMENGVMLVGDESPSLVSDLRRIPTLLVSFVAQPVMRMREFFAAGAIAEPVDETDFEAAA